MLKKKKGFNIATKSAQSKLLRDGFDLLETKTVFNEVVAFYFALVNTHPEGIDLSTNKEGGWRYYELLTIGDEARYGFPFNGFPALLRRSAIRKAIGAWSSWHSNYLRWLSRPQKHKHHRPPVQPRHFNFSPSYDAGVWKEDDGESIVIKILVEGQWKWVKFFYQSPPIDPDWVKGSPSIVCKGKNVYITWTLAKYIPATGGIKKVMAADSNRVCSVDTDLDRHIAICTILETKANGKVSEVARLFINQRKHVKREVAGFRIDCV